MSANQYSGKIDEPQIGVDKAAVSGATGAANAGKAANRADMGVGYANANGIVQGVKDTKGAGLNENQGANYATNGGQFGRANNKDYSTTLRLARQADAYNAKPQAEMYHAGRGGPRNMGTGYQRPSLNTQEQKAADQTLQLDTNQKMLAQQLQAAINGKDFDAFKQAVAQKFGMNMSDYQMRTMFNNMIANQQINQLFNREAQLWQRQYGMWDTADKLNLLNNMVLTHPEMAPLYGSWLGIEGPGMMQLASFKSMQNMLDNIRRENPNIDPYEAIMQAQLGMNLRTGLWDKMLEKSDNGKYKTDTWTMGRMRKNIENFNKATGADGRNA